jgi:HK97 family phage prohead protease
MLHKSCPVKVKATGEADGLEEGQFEAIVSVFGNRDSYGDVVVPDAFKDTLAEWEASGNPIPVYYSHRMDDPDYNIGHVLEAKETDEGLWIKGQLDLDDEAKKARQVYRLLKGRRLTQFSFAYDIEEGGWATRKNGDVDEEYYELRKLKLYEAGPTPIGANQETELLGVKSAAEHAQRFAAEVKAGRVLSSKNENTLREAVASLDAASKSITDVLAAVGDEEKDQEKNAQPEGPAKDEEPTAAKSNEPRPSRPADVVLAVISIEERN